MAISIPTQRNMTLLPAPPPKPLRSPSLRVRNWPRRNLSPHPRLTCPWTLFTVGALRKVRCRKPPRQVQTAKEVRRGDRQAQRLLAKETAAKKA
jgi:hypothetical protein